MHTLITKADYEVVKGQVVFIRVFIGCGSPWAYDVPAAYEATNENRQNDSDEPEDSIEST